MPKKPDNLKSKHLICAECYLVAIKGEFEHFQENHPALSITEPDFINRMDTVCEAIMDLIGEHNALISLYKYPLILPCGPCDCCDSPPDFEDRRFWVGQIELMNPEPEIRNNGYYPFGQDNEQTWAPAEGTYEKYT